MNRRSFLRRSATFVAATPLFSRLSALPPVPVRQSINGQNASAAIVVQYARAVDMMKKLPANDQRNWTRQAQIHNNFCPHGNWWFLPWHRAYLYYFESICQDVLGDPTFRLPYWNWTKSQDIPTPFLDQQSSLNDGTRRNTHINADVSQDTINTIVRSSTLLDLFSGDTTSDQQRQDSTTGVLEGGPHNGVHGSIGGDMGNFMSPLDPIFWLHHCNIDRIWASWQRISGNSSPTNALWTNHALTSFYDPVAKTSASPRTGDMPGGKWLLPYDSYETPQGPRTMSANLSSVLGLAPSLLGDHRVESLPSAPSVKKASSRLAVTRGVGVGQVDNFQLKVPATPVKSSNMAILSLPAQSRQVYITIDNVPMPSDPSAALRVFLNCEHPSLQTSITDPTYVGTISFFGSDHHGSGNRTFALNATQTLERLVGTSYSPSGNLKVSLVAVDLINPSRVSPEAVVRPTSLSIINLAADM